MTMAFCAKNFVAEIMLSKEFNSREAETEVVRVT